MSFKADKSFWSGLIAGAVVVLLVVALQRHASFSSRAEIAAKLDGRTLSIDDLQEAQAAQLIPIQNDEYAVLRKGAEDWLEQTLLEREADAKNMSVAQLQAAEIWSQVQVTEADALHYYNENKALMNPSFSNVSDLLIKQLREQKYQQVRREYIAQLQKKYRAEILLPKPGNYIPKLGIASAPANAAAVVADSRPGVSPSRGPANAKVTIEEFADFQCGFCKKSFPTIKQLREKYPNDVREVFHHFPLSQTSGAGSFLIHEAAACAQEQGKFWEFHDAAFSAPGSVGQNEIQQMASQIGLNTTTFQACMKSGRAQAAVLAEKKIGEQKGIRATPTFLVNQDRLDGAYPYEKFDALVQYYLNPGKGPKPVVATSAPAPDPNKRVTFNDLDGKPSKGPKNAPVTIVEFSDFMCPFCNKVNATIDEVLKNYPDKVRLVWRHYPLSFHKGSDRIHEASECAHEQNKFWEYHSKVFASFGQPRDDKSLIKLAKEAGANEKKFEKCLSSGKYQAAIKSEVEKGNQAGVRGTPSFFVNGKFMSGAQPYSSFEQAVKSELESKKS